MKKNILNLAKILIYLTFFVPLVIAPASFIFPFVVPKILLFRSLVVLSAGCYVLLLIINWREYKPKFTALNLVLLSFLFSFFLSTVFGVDPYHSFWDNHERMLGLFTILHYIIYYFVSSAIFKNWKDWQTALKVFMFAGSIVMLIGFIQIQNPNFLMNQGSDRVASTLGNSIYVSGYGLFMLFTSLLLFFKEKNKNWRWMEAVSAVLGLMGIFFGGSRGAILGLLIGLFCMAAIYGFTSKENPRVKKILLYGLVSAVLLFGLAFIFRTSKLVSNIPALGRLFSTSISELTGGPRLIAWKIAVDSWKERPVFGWGPNNFFYAFNKYYNPRSLEFGYGETWFDSAHNIILNTLTVQGVFGVIIYLGIFVIAILTLLNLYRTGKIDKHWFAVGGSFLVAHLAQNVTVFENPTSYMYFMFWLAMINHLASKGTEDVGRTITGDKSIGAGAVILTGIIVSIIIFVFNIQPARANMLTLKVLKSLNTNPAGSVEIMREALSFNSPHIDDIRSDISRLAMQTISANAEKIGSAKSMEIFTVADEELRKNLILHPLDIRNHIILSQLSQAAYEITKDSKYVGQTEQLFKDAITFSPKRQQLLFGLSTIYMQMGKLDESVRLLEQAMNDNPKIGESYWRLAYIYYMAGEYEKAKEVMSLAEEGEDIMLDSQGRNAIETIRGAIEEGGSN